MRGLIFDLLLETGGECSFQGVGAGSKYTSFAARRRGAGEEGRREDAVGNLSVEVAFKHVT
jgi:hypothetical protein